MSSKSYFFRATLLIATSAFFGGCASAMKARMAEREKVAASSGLFCEFINGEDFADIDVQLNIQMAKKCDGARPFSISDYKSSSDIHGMLFCCNMARDERPAPQVSRAAPAPEAKVETPEPPAPVPAPAPKAPAKPAAPAPKAPAKPAGG